MSYQRQIDELNTYVKTYIGPSKIHGVGVFALRDIPEGSKLFADMTPRLYDLPHKEFQNLLPEIAQYIIERFPTVVKGSLFGYPDTRVVAFMNHSDKPNYDAINDVVLRQIEKGEEITEDYRLIDGYQIAFPWLKSKRAKIKS